MGFEVAEKTPRTIWAPIDTADTAGDTLYVGQLVYAGSDGVLPLGAASGVADENSAVHKVPFGVVIGTNNDVPVFNTTYKAEYITSVASQASQVARNFYGVEGMWSKGDPQAFVHLALIDPCTILKGRIFTTTYGVAPTVVTATAASTDGLVTAGTTGACDFTPVADLATIYCRSGANAGLYRTTVDVSTTAPQVDTAYPYDVAIGDTFVRVPMRPMGPSTVQFDSESTFIDCASGPVAAMTNRYSIFVYSLDLRTAGQEVVYFRFDVVHFDQISLRSAS